MNCTQARKRVAKPIDKVTFGDYLAVGQHMEECQRCESEIDLLPLEQAPKVLAGIKKLNAWCGEFYAKVNFERVEVMLCELEAENPDPELLEMIERGRNKMEQMMEEHRKNTE